MSEGTKKLSQLSAGRRLSANDERQTSPGSAPRFCLTNGDAATHPFNVLQIVDGGFFIRSTGEVDKGKATLAAGFPIQRQRTLADLAVLAEQMNEVFSLSVPGEIANENRQKKSQKPVVLTIAYSRSSQRLRRRRQGTCKVQQGCSKQGITLQHQQTMHRHGLAKIRRRRTIDQASRFAAGDDVLERHGHDSRLAQLRQSPPGLPLCSGIAIQP